MADPLVSALIPVRNNEAYLADALESALGQTHARVEVVVVDNGSTDRSGEIARSYAGRGVTVHEEPEPGVNRARNTAVACARGDYLAFLDADDLWEPRKTEWQLEALSSDGPPDLVTGHVQQFLSPDCDPSLAERLRVPAEPQPGLLLGTVLAPRWVFERIGPLSPGYAVSDGLEWFLRARSLALREVMLPQVVTHRRVHGGNHSYRARSRRGEFAALLKASIDERRRGAERTDRGGQPG